MNGHIYRRIVKEYTALEFQSRSECAIRLMMCIMILSIIAVAVLHQDK